MSKKNQRPTRPHRLSPAWSAELDREGLARALLLLAMHLDEKQRMAHKKQQNPASTGPSGKKGGGSDENA